MPAEIRQKHFLSKQSPLKIAFLCLTCNFGFFSLFLTRIRISESVFKILNLNVRIKLNKHFWGDMYILAIAAFEGLINVF